MRINEIITGEKMPLYEILSTNCVRKCTCEYRSVGPLGQLILLFANGV